MLKSPITISIVVALLCIGGAILLATPGNSNSRANNTLPSWERPTTKTKESVPGVAVIEGDTQYIDITAQGGYWPKTVRATASMPTILRMRTENTYDCSMALVINGIGYRSFLKPSGVEEIEIPIDKTQGTLKGMCSMAMYDFEIVFE
jgi:plastocyanin domain-containing protein